MRECTEHSQGVPPVGFAPEEDKVQFGGVDDAWGEVSGMFSMRIMIG
jgi:hypothetical protein